MKPRKFAAFDIDGTIFRWQLYHELVFDLAKNGQLPGTFQADIAPYLERWRRREDKLAFAEYELRLVSAFAKNLKGLSVQSLTQSANRVMAKSSDHVYTYSRDLLLQLKSQGYLLIALSGSFEQVVEPFAKKYNFDYWVGTNCEHKDGKFTGQVVWNYDKKAQNINALAGEHNLTFEDSIAVGDTASDISLLKLVQTPIAFNPNQELFDYATKQNWDIVVERKNVVYKLEPSNGRYTLSL